VNLKKKKQERQTGGPTKRERRAKTLTIKRKERSGFPEKFGRHLKYKIHKKKRAHSFKRGVQNVTSHPNEIQWENNEGFKFGGGGGHSWEDRRKVLQRGHPKKKQWGRKKKKPFNLKGQNL